MQWIVGFEGRYQINDRGDVLSFVKGLPVPLAYNSQGRGKRTIKLYDEAGRGRWFQLHRLVAEAFLKPPIRGERFVQFRDGDTFNVSASNLYWTRKPERYTIETDLPPFVQKQRVQHIRRSYYVGEDEPALARRFGMCQKTIKAIINRQIK